MPNYVLSLDYVKPEGVVKNGKIFIRDGLISFERQENEEYKELIFDDAVAVPGFIDTHIHGFAGFGSEDGKEQSILNMSSSLIRYGVTTFFPTIYTDTLERIIRDEIAIEDAIGKEKGAKIGGIHIEGPFISPNKIGAQNPLGRKEPSVDVLNRILSVSSHIKAMTMAPELKGSAEIASILLENGIIPLQGHTDATYEESLEGIHNGIRHFTHLYNAMTGLVHRAPGVVGSALSGSHTSAEIIADGLHVHPAAFKVALNAIGEDRVVSITDSLKPTEQDSGTKSANGVEVEMLDGLWVTKGNTSLIQGSALNMHKAFRNLVSWDIPLNVASKLTATNAARIYSLNDRGEISENKKADLVIMDKRNLDIKMVLLNGEIKYVV